MKSYRDASRVFVCDAPGCYKVMSQRNGVMHLDGREYDACSAGCMAVINRTHPLRHRTPEEVWDSEAREQAHSSGGVVRPVEQGGSSGGYAGPVEGAG